MVPPVQTTVTTALRVTDAPCPPLPSPSHCPAFGSNSGYRQVPGRRAPRLCGQVPREVYAPHQPCAIPSRLPAVGALTKETGTGVCAQDLGRASCRGRWTTLFLLCWELWQPFCDHEEHRHGARPPRAAAGCGYTRGSVPPGPGFALQLVKRGRTHYEPRGSTENVDGPPLETGSAAAGCSLRAPRGPRPPATPRTARGARPQTSPLWDETARAGPAPCRHCPGPCTPGPAWPRGPALSGEVSGEPCEILTGNPAGWRGRRPVRGRCLPLPRGPRKRLAADFSARRCGPSLLACRPPGAQGWGARSHPLIHRRDGGSRRGTAGGHDGSRRRGRRRRSWCPCWDPPHASRTSDSNCPVGTRMT